MFLRLRQKTVAIFSQRHPKKLLVMVNSSVTNWLPDELVSSSLLAKLVEVVRKGCSLPALSQVCCPYPREFTYVLIVVHLTSRQYLSLSMPFLIISHYPALSLFLSTALTVVQTIGHRYQQSDVE